MARKRFNERLTDALRGDVASIIGIFLFLALWVVSYYLIDYVLHSITIINLVVSFFVALYLSGLIAKVSPQEK